MNNAPLPVVGKKYHFFDDGKIKPSRHYIAKIVKLIPFSEFENVKYEDLLCEEEATQYLADKDHTGPNLLEIWKEEIENCDWVFAKETDYAVKAIVEVYDDNPIFFVRDKHGAWFSLGTVTGWESGRLDIDNSLFDTFIKEYYPDYHILHQKDLE